MTVDEMFTEVTKLINDQADLTKASLAEMRKTGAVPSEFKEKLEAMASATEKITNAYTDMQKSASDLAKKNEELEQALKDVQTRLNRKGSDEDGERLVKTPGELFTADEYVKEYLAKQLYTRRGMGAKVELPGFSIKDIVTEGQGTTLIYPQRRPGIMMVPDRPMTIRGLLPTLPVSSNSIEYVKESAGTNNAGPQYDAVSSPPKRDGAKKNKSDLAYTKATAPIETLAHYMKASKQILSDVPQLQAMINQRLLYFLELEEERQILRGDGTGGDLLGLIPQAADYDTGLNKANDTQIDRLRHAILQVTRSMYMPDGIVINPENWHDIELTKTNEGTTSNQGSYLMTNPSSTAAKRLWGLSVLDSLVMNVDEFLVGAFRLGASILDREQAGIEIANQNEDDFIRNLVTILAEERVGLAVYRPDAFVTGAFA